MTENNLNWNDLRYFLEVARQGRLLGAARRLGVNHSTVARRLVALENALQTPLFEQDENGFHLTQRGEALLPLAQQVEDVAGLMREEAGGNRDELGGRLRLGAPDGFDRHVDAWPQRGRYPLTGRSPPCLDRPWSPGEGGEGWLRR